jgi:hypothetical protein
MELVLDGHQVLQRLPGLGVLVVFKDAGASAGTKGYDNQPEP